MNAECHVWKTRDGRLVAAGDPEAATLAYAPGDEVNSADEEKVRALSENAEQERDEQPAQAKQAAKPADKAAKREGDK